MNNGSSIEQRELAYRCEELSLFEYELEETKNVLWWLRTKGYRIDVRLPRAEYKLKKQVEKCQQRIEKLKESVVGSDNEFETEEKARLDIVLNEFYQGVNKAKGV